MSGEIRNCAHCRHIEHTSPTQVFWRCSLWCSPAHYKGWADSYVWAMCHRQPEAPACQFFEEKPTKRRRR